MFDFKVTKLENTFRRSYSIIIFDLNLIAMHKKFLLALLALVLLSCQKENTKRSEAVHAIPIDAAMIIVSEDLNNTIEAVKEISIINQANPLSLLLNLDSNIEQYSLNFRSENPLYVSLHSTGAQSLGWLAITSTKNQEDKIKLLEIAVQGFSDTKTHKYSSATINELTTHLGTLYYSITQGLVICSQQKLLIEDAIRQLKTENNLTHNTAFSNIYNSSNKKEDLNIYISSKNFDKISGVFLQEKSNLYHTSEWIQWDIDLLNDGVLFSGLSISHDSLAHTLTNFSHNPGHQILTSSILPNNTAFFVSRCFENYKQYKRKKEEGLQKKHLLNSYIRELSQFPDNHIHTIESWIDSELSYFVIENSSGISEGASAHIANEKEVESYLQNNTDSIFNYRGKEVYQWKNFGFLFKIQNIDKNAHTFYGTCLNEHLVITKDIAQIKNIINDFKSKKTLNQNEQYKLSIDELSSKSNLFIYAQNPSILSLASNYLTQATNTVLLNNREGITKLKSFALQFTVKDNISYSNAYLAYNEVNTTNTRAIWSKQLDNDISSKISIVKNHYTHQGEIVVQDNKDFLYLLSPDGEILWKRKLNEQIIGEVQQIDAFKNNKLQLLFNTKSKLHLIDRKGRDVGNFPIKLKSETNLPLALFDYENNRNYRILISSGTKHYMYNSKGTIVRGWKFKNSKSHAAHPAQHFVVANKDYILLPEENGTLNILNRKGENRLKVKDKIAYSSNPLQVVHGKNLAETRIIAIDKSGMQQNILFDGSIDNSLNFDFEKGIQYKYNQEHHILVEGSHIKVNGDLMNMRYSLESDLLSESHSKLLNQQLYISITDQKNKQSYLFKSPDELVNGFPVYGTSTAKIDDIDRDGTMNLITIGESGIIYNYAAE